MTGDLGRKLREARERLSHDREQAIELFRRVAASSPGPEWSEAQLELATLAFNEWNLPEVMTRTRAVLQLDASVPTPEARRHAALMLNQARDNVDEAVDEDEVRWARAELEAADEHYAAAQASFLLATVAARRGAREVARCELDRAETRYVLAGSMYGVPSCEHRRARLCMDDGDDAGARVHLRRALDQISRLPLGLENVKAWIRRLQKLDAELTARTRP